MKSGKSIYLLAVGLLGLTYLSACGDSLSTITAPEPKVITLDDID